LGDLSRFVIATEDGDALWVSNLEGDEKRDRLDRVVAAVDVVTCKACQDQKSPARARTNKPMNR
jgi:hypothetical protein